MSNIERLFWTLAVCIAIAAYSLKAGQVEALQSQVDTLLRSERQLREIRETFKLHQEIDNFFNNLAK